MTGMAVMFAMLALLPVIWVLRRNARDRETFEEELKDDLRDGSDADD